MWSAKSGCMFELLTPLSRPVSATVTMTPDPSRPVQPDEVAPMLAVEETPVTFMMWRASSLKWTNHGRGSIHSRAGSCASALSPSLLSRKSANRPLWLRTSTPRGRVSGRFSPASIALAKTGSSCPCSDSSSPSRTRSEGASRCMPVTPKASRSFGKSPLSSQWKAAGGRKDPHSMPASASSPSQGVGTGQVVPRT